MSNDLAPHLVLAFISAAFAVVLLVCVNLDNMAYQVELFCLADLVRKLTAQTDH